MGAVRQGGRHVDRLTVAGAVARAAGDHAPVGTEQLDREAGGQGGIERERPDRDRLAERGGEGVMVDARVDATDDGEPIAGSVDHDRRSVDRLGRFRGVVAVDDRRDADHVDHRCPEAPPETLEDQRRRLRGGDEPERVPCPLEAELRPRNTGILVRHPCDRRAEGALEPGRAVEERDLVRRPGHGHERLSDASPPGAAIEREIGRVHPAVGGVQAEVSLRADDEVPINAVAPHDPPGDRIVRLVAAGIRADPLVATVIGDRIVTEFERSVDDQIRRRIRSFLLDRGIDDHTEVVAPASLYPDHPDCVLTRGRHPHRLNEGPLAGRGGIGRRNDSDPIGTDELDANALASAPGDHGTDDLPGSHVDEPRVDLACPDDRSRRSGGRHARRHRHEHERCPERELEARRQRHVSRRVLLPNEQAVEALDGSE